LCYRVFARYGENDMAKKKKATPHLRIRIEPELLARLENSRKAQGRTLTGEIVHRIEQSFRRSEDADLTASTLRAAFGGATGDLLRAIAIAVWLIEKRTGKKWNENPHAGSLASIALDTIGGAFSFPLDAKRIAKRIVDIEEHLGPSEQSDSILAFRAAITALQPMGMAPSDPEIAKEIAELRTTVERIRSTVSRITEAEGSKR
jgi:hypothetical protein